MNARWMLRIIVTLVITTCPCPWALLVAQEKQPKRPELTGSQIEAEIERVTKEIDRQNVEFRKTTTGKKVAELTQERYKLEQENSNKNSEFDREWRKVQESPETKQHNKQLYELGQERDELVVQKYSLAKRDGRERARRKHSELEKFAVKTPELQALGLTVLDFPRIDGSTSTQPLAALIACHAFAAPREWVPSDQPGRRDDPFGFQYYEWPEVQLAEYKLIATGETIAAKRVAGIINNMLAANASTHDAYLNVIEGRSDIGLICRQPSDDETAAAKKTGVELDLTPIARDAFVFIVNEKNTVTNLTTAKIRELYSRKNAAPFNAYQRSENSGSQELMKSLVMKGTPLYKPTERFQGVPLAYESLMSSVFLKLTSDEAGLAYSVWYYEQFMIGSARTKMISVDGVLPTFETIQQGKYPYVAPVMFVTRKDLRADSPTLKLRQWLLSAEGQAVVKQSGYVPVK